MTKRMKNDKSMPILSGYTRSIGRKEGRRFIAFKALDITYKTNS